MLIRHWSLVITQNKIFAVVKLLLKIWTVPFYLFQLPPTSSPPSQTSIRYPWLTPPVHKHRPKGVQDEFCPSWLLAKVHSENVNQSCRDGSPGRLQPSQNRKWKPLKMPFNETVNTTGSSFTNTHWPHSARYAHARNLIDFNSTIRVSEASRNCPTEIGLHFYTIKHCLEELMVNIAQSLFPSLPSRVAYSAVSLHPKSSDCL